MDFAAVLDQICRDFAGAGIDFALIGGFALGPLGVARATADLDLLAAERGDDIAAIMTGAGYHELHRSADAANYAADEVRLGRVDVLFARRPYSLAMLARAPEHRLPSGQTVKIVEPEDLIGLKVQASSNNPARALIDLGDIERLLRIRTDLDIGRVREYFRLFDREDELNQLLARIKQ